MGIEEKLNQLYERGRRSPLNFELSEWGCVGMALVPTVACLAVAFLLGHSKADDMERNSCTCTPTIEPKCIQAVESTRIPTIEFTSTPTIIK